MYRKLLFIVLTWFVVTPVSGDTIYKWKDESGTTCYSNIAPPPGINCQITEPAAKNLADEILTIGQPPPVEKKTEQIPAKQVEARETEEIDLSSYKEKRDLIEQRYSEYLLGLDDAYKRQDKRSIKALSDEMKKMDQEKAQIAKEIKDKTGGFLPEWWHNENNNM